MTETAADPKVSIGFASEKGERKRNEDFVGAIVGDAQGGERRDVVAALADGIGGHRGGREAAETAVRGFLDGFWEVPETLEVRWAAARILTSLNRWMHAQGRQDADLAGMGTTFTALVLRGRLAHVVHVGDSRAYRLSGERLTRLTEDHVRLNASGQPLLFRALGVEAELRLDYAAHPIALHDRFMLCSDGVHATLTDEAIAEVLRARTAPTVASQTLVNAALAAGSPDNCTALVLDVVGLPQARSADIGRILMQLPIIPAPHPGETIDGFALKGIVSEGRYSRLLVAEDEIEQGSYVLKFPQAQVGTVASQHAAFVREAWVGARVQSPWVARVVELPPGRQTCLYTVMPLYGGELLDARLNRRPSIGLEEGRGVGVKLSRAAAALHRVGVIHRDIKPDNVMLEHGGGLKLLDLGVVRVPGLEDETPTEIPGTAAYMAPEMFAGEPGDDATDVYAIGVTLFRAFTGEYPYGNVDATSRPRLERPKDLLTLRPDLPAWLQDVLERAIAADPALRPDAIELANELESGPVASTTARIVTPTFYQRRPVLVWQVITGLLALALIASLLLR
ncbi:MAG TPA: protein kinase [Caulobacteraceae bacterium]|nr:protein kinase [Caulobacteraceae bacterium]